MEQYCKASISLVYKVWVAYREQYCKASIILVYKVWVAYREQYCKASFSLVYVVWVAYREQYCKASINLVWSDGRGQHGPDCKASISLVWCGVMDLHEKCSTSINLVWYSVVWISAIFTQSDWGQVIRLLGGHSRSAFRVQLLSQSNICLFVLLCLISMLSFRFSEATGIFGRKVRCFFLFGRTT